MKDDSLIKISPPRVSHAFLRERLFQELDTGMKFQQIWISSPAGSGKTTLVASYLKERNLSSLWYQIDDSDSDIANFFHFLGLAEKQINHRKKHMLPHLSPEYLPKILIFSRRFFEKLFRQVRTPCAIVFDNYQDVLSPAFHGILAHGIESVPDGIAIIMISRASPPPEFARFIANNQMFTLGWNDVRFNLKESGMLLESRRKSVAVKSIETLHNMTEGWAVGLILASKVSDLAQSVSPNSDTAVFDYFAEEVLNKLDNKSKEFLLTTSILPNMRESVITKLTGDENAGNILASLYRNHLFIEKLELSEPGYVYHPLFKNFLVSFLKKNSSPEKIKEKTKLAALLLEQENQIDDAMFLYLQIGDFEKAAALIEAHAKIFLSQGRRQTLELRIKSIPAEQRRKFPWLEYWLGACAVGFNFSQGREHFTEAYRMFKADNNASGRFLAWVGIVDSILYSWDDFKPLDFWIDELDEILLCHPEYPSFEIEVLVSQAIFGALLYRRPEREKILKWEIQLDRIMPKIVDEYLRIAIKSNLLMYHLWVGNWPKATQLMRTLPSKSKTLDAYPLAQLLIYVTEAMYFWTMGDVENTDATITSGLALAEATGIHNFDFLLLSVKLANTRDNADKEAISKKIQSMIPASHRLGVSNYYHNASCAAFLQNNIVLSLEYINTAIELTIQLGTPIPLLYNSWAQTIIYAELNEFEACEKSIIDAKNINKKIKSAQFDFLGLLTRAWLAWKQNDKAKCIHHLRSSFLIGKKNGYLNVPYKIPSILARLCAVALEAEVELSFTRALITKLQLIPPDFDAREKWPWLFRFNTLGKFEIIKDNLPIHFSGKIQQIPLALLKALIGLGPENVSIEFLMDSLWPDAEGDHAHNSFNVALNRLRKLLGNENIVQLTGGQLSLNPDLCQIDIYELKKLLVLAENALANPDFSEHGFKKYIRRLEDINKGTFLSGEDRYSWIFPVRESLASEMRQIFIKTALCYETSNQPQNEIMYLNKALKLDNLSEETIQKILVCYHRLNRKAEGVQLFKQWEKRLWNTLGIQPGKRSIQILEEIIRS